MSSANMVKQYHPKFKFFFNLLLFGLSICTCYSQKIDSIKIGNGGGFTAQVTVYTLSKNNVKKEKGISSSIQTKTVSYKGNKFKKFSSESKKIYKTVPAFSHPFNTYKFLEIYSKGKPIKYTWGDPGFRAPDKIENLYNQIIELIQSLNFNQQ